MYGLLSFGFVSLVETILSSHNRCQEQKIGAKLGFFLASLDYLSLNELLRHLGELFGIQGGNDFTRRQLSLNFF